MPEMLQPEAVVSRLAGALHMNGLRFVAENKRLAGIGEIASVTNPAPRHQLTRGVWLDYEADRGIDVSLAPSAKTGVKSGTKPRTGKPGLRITLRDRGQSRWLSLSYAVNAGAVTSARFIAIVLTASSVGQALLRPCLRHHFRDEDGFYDQFLPNALLLPGGHSEQLCFVRPDPAVMARSNTFEILFFLEGRAFDITLLGVENLHI